MQIHDLFERDIDRNINGVIQVADDDAIKQELDEYVVTRELRRHFSDFFRAYEDALDTPTDRVGVWVSGYFGSGKSHFLKMLSYLLENPEVDGKPAIDYFEGKIEDPMVMAAMRRSAEVETESILFNVDAEGGGWKEGETAQTALLRTFARVFYDHLSFYGTDYKLARFEKRQIDDKGATQRFREAYERITGERWVDDRDAYEFHSDDIAQAAHEAVGLDPDDVERWIDSDAQVTLSPNDLVADVKSYVERRKRECGGKFRLLFMADEVGQFIGSNASLMLNLQTIVERLGSECRGDAWVVVTSQEAIDEMRTIVENDFSKIQGRFATRLSLSSSSVDEVIKRRVLWKTDAAVQQLRATYQQSSAVLRNLFTFERSTGDLVGYTGEGDFVSSYPFVDYQFTLMPQVLNQIRRHGYSGKHLSTGERSMLSAFKESAQAIEREQTGSLAPFWRFFDTLERQLDHGIKQVFERARRAAEAGHGLEPYDVEVLKALYLVVYIPQQIATTIPNVAVLMADGIDVDTMALKARVKESLGRLVAQNYVTRDGQRYTFLTDQEQDVEREIQATQIDSSDVLERIKGIVYAGIYTATRLRKGANDFPVDRYVDDTIHGRSQNGMRLNVITAASELYDCSDAELGVRSMDQALVMLAGDGDYYELVQEAAKVRKYVGGINREGLPDEKRRFVERKQRQATDDIRDARTVIEDAIVHARVAVDGQVVTVPATTAAGKLEAVLDRLAGCVFTRAEYVDAPLSDVSQLRPALEGHTQMGLTPGDAPNARACDEMERYLDAQDRTLQQVSFGDLQRHFQQRPYGWRQDDVSLVLATLMGQQKASIIYGGAVVTATDQRTVGLLTKQSGFDKVGVRIRRGVSAAVMREAKDFLREVDRQVTVPPDEDGLVAAIVASLEAVVERCDALAARYRAGKAYPGLPCVRDVRREAKALLAGSREPEAFLRAFGKARRDTDFPDDLEDMATVEGFFRNQVTIFDDATRSAERLRTERVYFEGDPAVTDALAQIEQVLGMQSPYGRIKDLPELVRKANVAYDEVASRKRREVKERLSAALDDVCHYAESQKAKAKMDVAIIERDARGWASQKGHYIDHEVSCTKLDAIASQVSAWSQQQCAKVDEAVRNAAQAKIDRTEVKVTVKTTPQKRTKVLSRSEVCPIRLLESEAAVDEYVASIREQLMAALEEAGSVRLN